MCYMETAVTLAQCPCSQALQRVHPLNPSSSGQANLLSIDLLPVLAVLQVKPFLARGPGHDLAGAALEFLLDAFRTLYKWDVSAPEPFAVSGDDHYLV